MNRHSITKRMFSLNMTVSQGIRKLGYTAIDSIVKEIDLPEGMK